MFIENRFRLINKRIEEACSRSRRDIRDVNLVVVTKGQPAQKVIEVVAAGAKILGENYPEETQKKIIEMGELVYPEWHMIGHIQSRKIKYLVQYFSMIHSIDSLELASKLDSAFGIQGRKIDVLLEVNLSGEKTKSGFLCTDDAGEAFLLEIARKVSRMKNLALKGLMTMPPFQEHGATNRPYFSRCNLILKKIKDELELKNFNQLSMGTSFDFETAIEEGSTHVRIGEAIMGPRSVEGRV